MRNYRTAIAALVVCTVLFGAAIALRHRFNPWLANAACAAVALAASFAILRPHLEKLFAVKARDVLVAIASAAALVGLTHLGYRGAIEMVPALAPRVESLYLDIQLSVIDRWLAVAITIFVVLAEELLWRGVAIELLKKRATSALVVGAAAVVLYALPQLIGQSIILIGAAIAFGAVFTAQRIHYGRLTEPVITHAIWSVTVFNLWPLV